MKMPPGARSSIILMPTSKIEDYASMQLSNLLMGAMDLDYFTS